MTAWIERRRTGKKVTSFKVRWREGATKKASKIIHHLAQAEDLRREIDARLEATTRPAGLVPGDLSVAHAFDRWRDARLADGAIRAPYAAEAAAAWERLCRDCGWTRIGQARAADIDRWKAAKQGRGVRKPLLIARSVLNYARRVLRCPVDAAILETPLPRQVERHPPALLTDAQVAAILAEAARHGPHALALVTHLATYGCRPVEACRLRVGDFDAHARVVRFAEASTKSRSAIEHPVTAEHARTLAACCADRPGDAPLFLHPRTAEPWRFAPKGGSQQLIDWYWINIGARVPGLSPDQRGIYCLKDYAITRMEKSGIDDRTKASFTGHKTLSVFARYKTTNRDRQDAALQALPALPTVGANSAMGANVGAMDDHDLQNHAKIAQ